MNSFMDRLKTSINVFTGKAEYIEVDETGRRTSSFSTNSSFSRVTYDNTKSVLAPIMTRIAIDCASIPIRHVKVNEFGSFQNVVKSELNDRLTIMANIDQSGVAFIQDAVQTMLENGACALVPVEFKPLGNGNIDILSARVGTIMEAYTNSVKVSVYNEITGDRTEKILPKGFVAIAYNPLYSVMNEPNSTLRRLIDRLAILDVADGRLNSPQLDLIIQLPYSIKNERRQAEADRRLAVIEEQLNDSRYGIVYADATEKITQLNRPVTNDLIRTVEGLTLSLHSQLGLTPAIFSGEAEPNEVIAYNNRTILPIVTALSSAMVGSFLTRTAIRQGHTVLGIPNLFKMVALGEFADAADKLTRNEIATSNEMRAVVGMPPSKEVDADKLRNKNLNKQGGAEQVKKDVKSEERLDDKDKEQNDANGKS